jgi:DNA-directed RNA polymerase specialized sigma24 family protein
VAGDEFAVFYEQAYPGAKRLAHLLLNGSPVAEDVVQEAFTRVHDVFAELPEPQDQLRAAIVEVGSGRSSDVAPAVASLRGDGPVEVPDPLLDAVADLPARQRAALVLRYWAGLPDLAISSAIGVAPSQGRVLIDGAVDRLARDVRATNVDVERDLSDAFADEAKRVALPAPAWGGPRTAPTRRSRRRPVIIASALAAVVAAIVVTWPRRPLDGVMEAVPADRTPSYLVVSADGPLPQVDPLELEWAPQPYVVGPIEPGSFRAWQAADAQLVTYATIETLPGAYVLEVWCLEEEHREAVCLPVTQARRIARYDSLDDVGNRAVENSATITALRCLGDAGLDSDPRQPLPAHVDLDQVWHRCVDAARLAATSTFENLGGRIVADRADDPSIVE